MTAATTAGPAPAIAPRFAGLAALVRKERLEWRRGKRAWVVLIVTTLFMVLTATSSWINARVREAMPDSVPPDAAPISLDPLVNLAAAVNSQFFVLATIFAVAGLIVRERESGTLAWVASKPVSRSAIWLAKWINASVILIIVAALLPLALTAGLVVLLYGSLDIGAIAALGLGMAATVVLYVTVGLAIGAFVKSQLGVAAATLAFFALPLFVALIPLPLAQFLPHSILNWSAAIAMGAPLEFISPIAFLIWTFVLAALGMRGLENLEL